MRHIITGQILLIVCCIFYMIWWYRGFRPNVEADRLGGINGILLLITAVLGVAGILFSLMPITIASQISYDKYHFFIARFIKMSKTKNLSRYFCSKYENIAPPRRDFRKT